jgi:hypothetical protein
MKVWPSLQTMLPLGDGHLARGSVDLVTGTLVDISDLQLGDSMTWLYDAKTYDFGISSCMDRGIG